MKLEGITEYLIQLSVQNNRVVYESISEEVYNEISELLINLLPINEPEVKEAVGKFFYYGALHFDKFSVPTLYAYSEHKYHVFCKLLLGLERQEGVGSQNTPILKLHKIKWDFYNRYSLKPILSKESVEINVIIAEIEQISVSHLGKEKQHQFDIAKEELLLLLNGVLEKALITKIKTRLPYEFSNRSIVSFNIEGIDVIVSIVPYFIESNDSFIQVDSTFQISTQGGSRWQSSLSEIEISVNGFLDDSKEVAPLVFNIEEQSSLENWNSLYEFTYKLIEKLWWHFVTMDIETTSVVPIPKDIPFISFTQLVNNQEIGFNLTSNPSTSYKIKSSDEFEDKVINIEKLEELGWSKKCSVYAKTYLQLGQFKEALFWLNVATESLIEEFIYKVVDNQERYDELFGSVLVFESAEEILSKQFIDMKGKVQWPNTMKHASVFNKINILFKEYTFEVLKKDVLKQFSIVNSKRNLLFHGNSVLIDGNDIYKVYEAYKWLENNLK